MLFCRLQMSYSTGQRGGLLLQGSYDEKESAQSFAEALMAWRNSGKEEKLWTNPSDTKSMRICILVIPFTGLFIQVIEVTVFFCQ